MVDNENQWDDIEYSEGYEDNSQMEQYSEDDYEKEGYEDYEQEEAEPAPKKGSNPAFLVFLLVVLLAFAGYVYVTKYKNADLQVDSSTQLSVEQPQAENTEEMGDYFFNEASGQNANSDVMSVNFDDKGNTNVVSEGESGDVVATVSEQPTQNSEINMKSNEESAIMVSYSKPVRFNPFKPTTAKAHQSDAYASLNNTGFEIIEPPVESIPDENLSRLLQTQISGILYDSVSPSAIINLNGVDQFVKVGDNVGGYVIRSITRDKVHISYKQNTYVASVGQLFSRDNLESQQTVVNLQNKFAGKYRNK